MPGKAHIAKYMSGKEFIPLLCLGALLCLVNIVGPAPTQAQSTEPAEVPLVHARPAQDKGPDTEGRNRRRYRKLKIKSRIGIVDPHEPIDDIISRVRTQRGSGRYRELHPSQRRERIGRRLRAIRQRPDRGMQRRRPGLDNTDRRQRESGAMQRRMRERRPVRSGAVRRPMRAR